MEELHQFFNVTKEQFELATVFHRFSFEKVAAALNAGTRFVHYTNAETAMKMFKNKEVWLRKSTQMNDFMEIQHGLNCLSNAYHKHRDDIEKIFDSMFPGICKRIEGHFDGWVPTYQLGTYLACVSEHDDAPEKNEDRMGRLSLWRAYGGFSGVAVVMNGRVFHTPIASDALKAYVSPVAYLTVDGFEQRFLWMLGQAQRLRDSFVALGEQGFFDRVVPSFKYAALCTKHPGFFEEKEWRILYNPTESKSQVISESVESVGGIPQKVCKLPLVDRPDLGIDGISLPKLINRVIIGPTLYPFDIAEALVELLDKAGVENAWSKVVVSDIPLRQVR